MNIDDMNQGEMVEGTQPDIKESDTKSDLLVETHSIVISINEEVEDKHSGTKEPDRKSYIVEDTDINIDCMNQEKW